MDIDGKNKPGRQIMKNINPSGSCKVAKGFQIIGFTQVLVIDDMQIWDR